MEGGAKLVHALKDVAHSYSDFEKKNPRDHHLSHKWLQMGEVD